MQPAEPTLAPTTATGVPEGTLRIWLLGGLRVARDDRKIADADWRLSKARNIIKLVALAPGHQIHREYLMDLLWADLPPTAADNNFHQALHSARRALATVLDGRPASQVLVLRQGIVLIPPDIPLWVDVDAFGELSQRAIASGDQSVYYAAIDLYGGDLLPEDRYEEWAGSRREALQQQFVDLLLRLGRLHEAQREPTPAIDVYRRTVEIDPVCEEAHAGLMRLYALTNRRQQALRQFERLRDALADELDTEPDAETQRLYVDILDNRFPATPLPEPVAAPQPQPQPQPPIERSGSFVNRVAEMGRLLGYLDRALAGRGQIVLAGGEPGIGKTRLAEEFATHARERGAVVLWGRCYEGEGTLAFWPWSQVIGSWVREHDATTIASVMGAGAADIARILPELRQHLPNLPEPLPVGAEAERFRLFSSVTEFLRTAAGRQPLAVILDDLHWADRSSLLLLEFALNELAGSPIIGVGTYRDIEIHHGHPLQQILERLNRLEDNRRITVTGFDPPEVAKMAEVTGGEAPSTDLAAAIHEQTEGNPFFVREIVRLLVDEGRYGQHATARSWKMTVPRGVRETIGLRLDRLSDDALRLLTVAAVAGREFELTTVAHAAEVTIDRAIDLFDEGLAAAVLDELDGQPDRMRFAHALIRLTLYDEASQARRIRLHRRVGEAIEAIHPADLSPWLAELAGHFVACAVDGNPEKGIRYSVEAGQQSISQVAYGEAVEHFRQAVELVEAEAIGSEATDRYVELLLLLANALRFDGEMREARTAYIRAASLAGDAGQADLLARAALGIATTEGEAEVGDDASIHWLEQALEALPASATTLRASVLARLSDMLHYHDLASPTHCRELAQQAVELARHTGDPATLATALHAQLNVDWEPLNLAASLSITDEILQYADDMDDRSLVLPVHAQRLLHLLELGDLIAADRELDAYIALAMKLSLPFYLWSVTLKKAMRALLAGRFEEGERLALEAAQLGERTAPLSAHALYVVQQFVLLKERGGLESLEADLRRYSAQNLPSVRFERCLIAVMYCETGRDDEARAEIQEIIGERIDDIPANIFWLGVMALLADVCAHLGDLERCQELYRALAPFAGRIAHSGTGIIGIGPVSYYLGMLASTIGDDTAAADHLQDAIDLSLRVDARPFAARAQYALSDVLSRRDAPGDRDRAKALLDECRTTARNLGMNRLYERADNTVLRKS